ncbi:uncharacterized protein LOC108199227 [Daucus carota subsp. sativus]|uniref:uncharacterized protein LOC108199227 n=1 Tax=Daucus carota subsp. sativus TaxID=79200 RepID=UPI0007E1EA06|nr:PREDICTED: uncharacterized protein LOC108199227 [Daucus carota subsp. sativus]
MESSSSFLCCNDLLFEIFSQCSLKLVDKSKTVSKVCKDIMYEPMFMQYHKKKTGAIYGYLIQSLYKNNHFSSVVSLDDVISTVSLDFLPRKSQILASTDQGIMCCISRENGWRNERFYVCKLMTKQIQMLPNPKLRYMTDKVAMVVLESNPLRYKIIRLSGLETRLWSDHHTYLCEIFDSKTWLWEQSKIMLPLRVLISRDSIFVSGSVHWLLSDNRILAFDVKTTTHTIFSLPHDARVKENEFHTIRLVKYKGKLGLIKGLGSEFEIWELENSRTRVWKRIKEINAEAVEKKEPYCVPQAVGLYSRDVALMKGRDYIFYNFEDASLSVAKLDHHLTHPNDVFPFRSDLEPVDLRGLSFADVLDDIAIA